MVHSGHVTPALALHTATQDTTSVRQSPASREHTHCSGVCGHRIILTASDGDNWRDGVAHQCGAGGLHPDGPDQHGGVPEEFENKVRSVKHLT